MKKVLLGALLLLSTIGFGQATQFKFSIEGFTDFVVTDVENKTQQELYKKTLDWIQVTYKNPKEVLLAQIENEYVRFEGIQKNTLCVKSLGSKTCFDIKYQIEITFKDGKYKFDVLKVEMYIPISQGRGGWTEFAINGDNYSNFYKEDGEIRPMFRFYPSALEDAFNNLNKGLELFLKSESIQNKNNNW